MFEELISRMQYEPCILMFGNQYRKIDINVLDYPWNTIVTTNCELNLANSLNNGKRNIRDIMSLNDMQANLTDRNMLHVIRLFGDTYPSDSLDEITQEDISDRAVSLLKRVSEIIQRNGILLIEDFCEPCFSHKELRKALHGLYSDQKQVYIFNCKNQDKYLKALEEQGVAVLIEQSINDFFDDHLLEENIDAQEIENTVQIYIESGKNQNL